MSAGHQHGSDLRSAQKRALWIALAANGIFMVAEAVGGIVFNSLALLADAAHMLSDVAGLGIALVAQTLTSRPATARHTYGLQRAEVLGAQINGLTLVIASGWIVLEAVRRFGQPVDVAGTGLLSIAVLGLAVNVGSAMLLIRNQGRSLNMRAAVLHMSSDALGSVGAIAAGIAVVVWGAGWVDPVASIGIAALVLWSAWKLLRETTHVLMEGAPRDVDADEVEQAIRNDAAVRQVHHLHLWNIASDVPALSAHVVLARGSSLHSAQLEGRRLKEMLHDRFGIEHATLELECHTCEEDAAPSRTGDHS